MRQHNQSPLTIKKQPCSSSAMLVVAERTHSPPDLPAFVPGLEEMEVEPSSSDLELDRCCLSNSSSYCDLDMVAAVNHVGYGNFLDGDPRSCFDC